MTIMYGICAWLVIGVIATAIAAWHAGELELAALPWIPLVIVIWPILFVHYLGPWWDENKHRVIWKRK